MSKVTQGPNVKRLIAHKMSLLMIPPGTKKGQGLATGMAALMKPGNIQQVCKEATEWVEQAIDAVKACPDGGWWGDENEAIAGELLRQIDEKRREHYRRQGLSDATIDAMMKAR